MAYDRSKPVKLFGGRVDEVKLQKDVASRFESLQTEFDGWRDGTWKQIQECVLPYSGRNLATARRQDGTLDEDDGSRRDDKRINSTAYNALITTRAGLIEGLAPQSRPFFVPRMRNDELNSIHSVYKWLWDVKNIVLLAMEKSGAYDSIAHCMLETLGFGTSIVYTWEDMETIARCETDTIGEYRLAKDARGEINSVYREKWMSAANMREAFGEENLPQCVKNALMEGKNPNERFCYIHAIEPNGYYSEEARGLSGMKYLSMYYLKDKATASDKPFLRIKGFTSKPFEVLRWDVEGNATYGDSPVKQCLGEIKQVHELTVDLLRSTEKQVSPTIAAPDSLKSVGAKLGADRVIYYSPPDNPQSIKPIQENFISIETLNEVIATIEDRIKTALFNKALQAITEITKESTAYEISKVYEEKMILGGFVQRFNNKFLRRLIERHFEICQNHGLIPPAPQEIPDGEEWTIEFTSLLAQAQRSIGISSIEQSMAFKARIVALDPTVVDYIDAREHMEVYDRNLGLPPKMTRSEEEVQQIRAERQRQQQAMEQMKNADKMANAVKTANEVQIDDNSMLAKLAEQAQV